MSVLSFPDVVVFLFILIKGTFVELKCIFIAIIVHLGSKNANNDSNKDCKDLDDDENDQTHQENKDFKTNEKIVEIYVSVIFECSIPVIQKFCEKVFFLWYWKGDIITLRVP